MVAKGEDPMMPKNEQFLKVVAPISEPLSHQDEMAFPSPLQVFITNPYFFRFKHILVFILSVFPPSPLVLVPSVNPPLTH